MLGCTHKVLLIFGINKFNSKCNLIYLDPWKLLEDAGTCYFWSLDPPKINEGWTWVYFSWLIHLPYQSAISVFAVLSETEIWSNSFHTRDNLPHPFPQNCILEARIRVTRLMQFWSQPVRRSDSVSYYCCCCLVAVVSDSLQPLGL